MTQISLNASRLLAAATSIALLMLAPAVRADALQDISKQIKQGQHAQALEQIDKYLAGKPKDAQGRFLKGIVLTEMNKPNEAIAVFSKLTEDYPELPEPYNNLAVIYAQNKQYDKAKTALEAAIRTHPAYATAHENLGDIYARMASQAYDKALQIDSSNASAQNKLALIRDLMSVSARPGAVTARPSAPGKTQIASAPTPAKPEPKPEPKPKPEAKPEPGPGVTTEVRPPATTPAAESRFGPGNEATAEAEKAVREWAAAWTRKDVKAYLAAYASDFQTPGGETRTAWEAERKRRIDKPGAIEVGIEQLRVVGDGADRVTARFRQHYRSGALKTSAHKTLVLVRRDGRWLIQQERIGG